MNKETAMNEIRTYCRESIEDFDRLVNAAKRKMERTRMPLYVVDPDLEAQIWESFSDWCEDNEIAFDEYDHDCEEFDPEEILFEN